MVKKTFKLGGIPVTTENVRQAKPIGRGNSEGASYSRTLTLASPTPNERRELWKEWCVRWASMYVIYPADELINWLIARPVVAEAAAPPQPPFYPPTSVTSTFNPSRPFRQRSVISEKSTSTSTTTLTTTSTSSDTLPERLSQTTTTSSKKKPPAPEVVIQPPPRREKSKKKDAPSSPLPTRTLFTNPFKRDKIYPHESPLPGRKDLTRSNPRLTPTLAFTEPEQERHDTFVNYRERNTAGNLSRLKLQEKKVGFQEDYVGKLTPSGNTGSTGGPHSSNPFLFPKSESQSPVTLSSSSVGRSSAFNSKMNSILGGSVGSGGIPSSGSQGANLVTDASSLKDLLHPSLNETLKSHNALTFKLIRIGSCWGRTLSDQKQVMRGFPASVYISSVERRRSVDAEEVSLFQHISPFFFTDALSMRRRENEGEFEAGFAQDFRSPSTKHQDFTFAFSSIFSYVYYLFMTNLSSRSPFLLHPPQTLHPQSPKPRIFKRIPFVQSKVFVTRHGHANFLKMTK
ncbi:unnamed protein product [Allacma fusca]|uniref:Uncharacterized protein n=1 Tax=Allacma fusca TaxID=39272 RepID=A0A8J2M068_9HEXA|nr:unnamed protein product [Allacma fusca]